jgi:hypothetical protein
LTPIYIGDYYNRMEAWKAATASTSQLLVNCLESIDASLWLIAGNRLPQALTLLANSVEVAFKSELERIHRVLIADKSRLDYKALKSLLRDAFLAHPRGHGLQIPTFDMERTITFAEAMDRVLELYPMVSVWKSRLQNLYNLRNDIVHYGATQKQDGEYTAAVATVAVPFLTSFLREAQNVELEKFITPGVSRELTVAGQVCDKLQAEGANWALGPSRRSDSRCCTRTLTGLGRGT